MSIRQVSIPWDSFAPDGSGIGFLRQIQTSGGNRVAGETVTDHAYSVVTIKNHHAKACTKTYILIGGSPPQATSGSTLPGPNLDAPNLANGALNHLNNKIKGHEFHAGVFASEIPKAVDMIKYQSQRLYTSYKYARKGQFINAAKAISGDRKDSTSGKVASNFLEWTYGVLPLLKDIHEATKFIDKHTNPIKRSIDFRVGIKVNTVRANYYSSQIWDVKECYSQYQLICKSVEKQPMHVELGLTDPLTVLWNILPYSFVLDWLLPIGPWLSALNVERELKVGYVVRSNFIKNNWSAPNIAKIASLYYYLYSGTVSSTFYNNVVGSRSILPSLSGVSRLPAFNPLSFAVNTQHTINGLALIANRTNR